MKPSIEPKTTPDSNVQKKYPREYTLKELEERIDEYSNESVGGKNPDILAQHFAKAGLGIADLQRRYAIKSFWVSIVALLVALVSLVVTLFAICV